MHFSNPLALLLLLSVPVLIMLGPSLHGNFRRREAISIGIRLVIVTAIVLALAGLEIVQRSDRLAVFFLLDGSDSISSGARSEAEGYLQASLQKMGPDDQAGIIVFGHQAVVERPLSSNRQPGSLYSSPGRDQTDLEQAVRLALALLPPDAARRIVLLSDGIQTKGDAEIAGQLAAASGVQIVTVPLNSEQTAEVLIKDVSAPTQLREGETFDLQISIEANQPTESHIRVFANGQLIYDRTQAIQRGPQTFSLPLKASQSLANSGRFIRYQVQIEPQRDHYYQNNQAAAYSRIEGPPQLLLIAPPVGEPLPYRDRSGPAVRQDEAAQLLQVITGAGYKVEVSRPSGLPGDLADLANYDAVILVDVPARELTERQMGTLQSYVRDLGGGLLAVGGPTSFGVGGYYRTPLEEALPIEMQLKDQLRRPSLTMIFIIDHSGSMGETSGGVSKLDLAKEAAMRSIDLLNPADRVGVIAFDDSASWVVPVTDVSQPQRIINRIGTLRDGGGTDILAGLQAMAQVLPDDPASVKHVILLTDGGANPTGIPELVTRMNQEYGITLTTVGVGNDAAPYLANLAELGGGRYHFAADPGAIPRIFTEETSLASRSYMIERTFHPVKVGSSPILSGLDAPLPLLHGYVGTTARPVAQTLLVSDLNDPILATWHYGLGKATAFTSDASGRWASDWLEWQGFPTFWAQTIQSILPGISRSGLMLQVEEKADQATLIVDAQDENGAYLNGYRLHANIAAPDGEIAGVDLIQIAPGRYEGTFYPQAEGAYLISVTSEIRGNQENGLEDDQNNKLPVPAETAGWVRSYSPEYRQIDQDGSRALNRLAELTHGWVGSLPDTGGIFDHNLPGGETSIPIWPWLLTMAAILLPVDIAVRRLALSPVELGKSFAALKKRFAMRSGAREIISEPQRPASLNAFLRTKQRMERQPDEPPEKAAAEPLASPAPERDTAARISPNSGRIPSGSELSGDVKDRPDESSSGENTTASSLLAAKRKRNRRK